MRITAVLHTVFATALALAAPSASTATATATAGSAKTNAKPRVTVTVPSAASPTQSSPIPDGRVVTAHVTLNEDYVEDANSTAANSFTNSAPFEVELSAPGLRFGRTTFKFDRRNRESYRQVVTCRTDSGSSPSKDGAIVDVPVTLTYKFSTGSSSTSNSNINNNEARQQQQQQPPPPPPPTTTTHKETQVLQRHVISSGRCSGWGDPHLTTLDGVAYDFQKQGVFQLFKSRNFHVQIFQEKCGPVSRLKDNAPSCYQGVAVAFGASVAKLFIQNGRIQLAKGSPSLQWLSIEKQASAATDSYRIFTNVDHGTYVDVNLGTWADFGNYPYLNVALQVSPYFKQQQQQQASASTASASASVTGLMGNWNGDRSDDLTNNDQLAARYAASLTDNLFTCVNDACASHLQASSIDDANAMALPTEQSLLHQGYSVVAGDAIALGAFSPKLRALNLRRLGDGYTEGVVVPAAADDANVNATATATAGTSSTINGNATATTAAPTTEAPTPTPAPVDVTLRATQLCRQVISSVATCAKYVRNTEFFITNVCVADAALLGDLSIVDSSKLAYLRECRRELDARLESELAGKTETATLVKDRAVLLFGDLSRCAKGCSGRGECLAAGCKCDSGFTGHGCDIAI